VKRLIARSISRSVLQRIEAEPHSRRESARVRVLAVFARACNLVTPEGDVVALVLPEIGNGPFSVVVEEVAEPQLPIGSGAFDRLEAGMSGCLGRASLQVGDWEITLEEAEIWEPRPDWARLRRKRDPTEDCLHYVHMLALRKSPEGSVLGYLSNQATGSQDLMGFPRSVDSGMAAIWEALQHLEAGWTGNRAALRAGARLVAGLGGGLTPAGDDFLAGAMLWGWLAHPDPEWFSRELLAESVGRTTTLAVAFLRAAAGGECSSAWHRLLDELENGCDGSLNDAVRDVLSHGHTSGADMLAGFLGMSLRIREPLRFAGLASMGNATGST